MASKAFKKCVDPCPRYLTPDDTHDCCVFCLGEEHARDVFEGAICVHCELFNMKKLRSRLSLFSRKEGQPSASRDSGPTVAEARRRMKSWGSQADLADELERELSLSHESAGNEGEPLDYGDAISLTSSDPAASALLGYAQKEQEMSEGEEAETEPSQTSCPAYEELLEVMERATARLHLPWERTKMAAPPGRLDERYLSGHKPPAQVSLPFLPDLHTEVEREWKKPFSSRIHRFQHTSYANIARMRESGYERMPPVEETLASYLSMGDTASLKVPSLPFKSLQDTSRLNGRAYAAAGQAVASLHTMAVLQAYQADLLKDLDDGQGLSAAFETFIPRRPRSEPEQSRGPGPAWSEDRRRAQKASVATHAPPPPAGRARGRYRSRRGRRDLREVIQTKRSQQRSRPDWSKN